MKRTAPPATGEEAPRARTRRARTKAIANGQEVELESHTTITGPPKQEKPRVKRAEKSLTTDEHIKKFLEDALTAADCDGAFLELRSKLTELERAWAREHHMVVVSLHGATRKRALTPVVFKAMFDRVRTKLGDKRKMEGLLEVATLEFLNLVTGNKPASVELAEPFDALIGSYTYGGYHKMAHDDRGGDARDSGAIVIDAVSALAYATHQVMTCKGLLPPALVEAVACVYGESSANRSETGGMNGRFFNGGALEEFEKHPIVKDNHRAKDQLAEKFHQKPFQACAAVVGMLGSYYQLFSDQYGLPKAAVIAPFCFCAEDLSTKAEVVRTKHFNALHELFIEHGLLKNCEEDKTRSALKSLKGGESDLLQALEVALIDEKDTDGRRRVWSNERVYNKMKSWDPSLSIAVKLHEVWASSNESVAEFLASLYWEDLGQDAVGEVLKNEKTGESIRYAPRLIINKMERNKAKRGLYQCVACKRKKVPKKPGEIGGCTQCGRRKFDCLKEPVESGPDSDSDSESEPDSDSMSDELDGGGTAPADDTMNQELAPLLRVGDVVDAAAVAFGETYVAQARNGGPQKFRGTIVAATVEEDFWNVKYEDGGVYATETRHLTLVSAPSTEDAD